MEATQTSSRRSRRIGTRPALLLYDNYHCSSEKVVPLGGTPEASSGPTEQHCKHTVPGPAQPGPARSPPPGCDSFAVRAPITRTIIPKTSKSICSGIPSCTLLLCIRLHSFRLINVTLFPCCPCEIPASRDGPIRSEAVQGHEGLLLHHSLRPHGANQSRARSIKYTTHRQKRSMRNTL